MPQKTFESRRELFGSEAWQQAWFKAWGDLAGPVNPSACLGVYSFGSKIKRFIPIQIAAPLGVSSAGIASVRSEYFYFTAQPSQSSACIENFLATAAEQPWDQLCIPDIPINSNEMPLLIQAAAKRGWELMDRSASCAYSINTQAGTFDEYLQKLGKNSRLQLFNRRKQLEKLGPVELKNYWPDLDGFIQVLNGFHQKRWTKPAFSQRNLVFIEALLKNLVSEGHQVDLSVLSLASKPVAATLDLQVNGRVYNLQSGFLADLDSKLSLGTLNFGYKIEAAFNNPKLSCYDFMAGYGKKSDYKKAFATDELQLVTLTFVRSAWLKQLYRVRNAVYGSPLKHLPDRAALLLTMQNIGDFTTSSGMQYFC